MLCVSSLCLLYTCCVDPERDRLRVFCAAARFLRCDKATRARRALDVVNINLNSPIIYADSAIDRRGAHAHVLKQEEYHSARACA